MTSLARLFTCLVFVTALSNAGFDSVASAAPSGSITLEAPKAGIDYPTDVTVPRQLATASVLVIGADRIVIGTKSTLENPKAGVDYPTGTPVPERLKSARILVVGKQRVAITLAAAKAGIDYPTDAPTPTGLIWVFGNTARLPVAQIVRLEQAVAGIDFPTDGPPQLDRAFYVAIDKTGKRTRIK